MNLRIVGAVFLLSVASARVCPPDFCHRIDCLPPELMNCPVGIVPRGGPCGCCDSCAVGAPQRQRRQVGTIIAIARAGISVIQAAGETARRMDLLAGIQEANRKLDAINTKLDQLSNQVRSFQQKMEQQAQLGRLAALFGRDVERLHFFTRNTRLADLTEDRRVAWAEAVLSLRDDGVDHIMSSFHRMMLGRNIFSTKPIINVFIDGLSAADEQLWEKVDAFSKVLMEIQIAGYSAWLVALGFNTIGTGQLSEINRVLNLATERLTLQDRVVFTPLNSQSLRTWPQNTYGLVRVKNTGCPVGSWATGTRYHDTEDRNSANQWSNPIHMDGSWGSNNMAWKFCTKTSHGSGPQWPNGKYCIFAKNGCPAGLSRGFIHWDDEDSNNKNSISGTLPDGAYNRNTRMYFCCKTTGSTASEITLPIEKPFILFPLQGQGCQTVYKMTVVEEFFHWDCEDKRNSNRRGMPHPKETSGGKNMRVHMCYYERTHNF